MKIIIAGSRSITDWNFVHECIEDTILKLHFERFSTIKIASQKELLKRINEGVKIITEVISGGANGVDKLGEKWAKEQNIPIKRFPANWDKYGRKAGYLRNVEMAEYSDALIAVYDGKSKGTKHMIDIAKKKRLKVFIYTVKEGT